MGVSKHGKGFKTAKKKRNIQKQKQREMQNAQEAKPVNYTYHKDRSSVEIPLNAWQMLSYAASQLEHIAAFVSVMEQISQQHRADGTLLPIYQEDLEPIPGKFGPRGEPQLKLKDSFWEKRKPLIQFEKPSIVMADGKTVYEAPSETTKSDPEKSAPAEKETAVGTV